MNEAVGSSGDQLNLPEIKNTKRNLTINNTPTNKLRLSPSSASYTPFITAKNTHGKATFERALSPVLNRLN